MSTSMMQLGLAIRQGEEEQAARAVSSCLDEGLAAKEILEGAMMPAMQVLGERFSRCEAYIPELIVAAKAMEAGMQVLRNRIDSGLRNEGCVLLGTVEGDIHSIGKNLVRMCLEGAGFDVVDLGENVKAQRFADACRERSPQVVGLSALLSSTMQQMPRVIAAVRAVDPQARILVGGAPVTEDFARKIGADGYASDAFSAVVRARELVRQGPG